MPELFSSGYLFESKKEILPYAENFSQSRVIKVLTDLAKITNGVITGTVPEKVNGLVYNTAIVVNSKGLMGKQRKIHLTDYEKKVFSAGDRLPIFEVEGIKIGIAICFDIYFPELARILTRNGAEIICHPANFGGKTSLGIIKTRSLENKVWMVTANRIGEESNGNGSANFRGESQIINSSGDILKKSGAKADCQFTEYSGNENAKRSDTICSDYSEEWNKYKIEKI